MSVYFIKVGRYLKIGYSENPERRCANLWKSATRYSRPWDMPLNEKRELLLVIDGNKTTEHWVHVALEDFLSGCEWFIDEPQVREFMATAPLVADDKFGRVEREGGEFVPVDHSQMLPERHDEIDRLVASSHKRRAAA